jgi:oligosaccharide 4-alpha-D-glucosyltransferase
MSGLGYIHSDAGGFAQGVKDEELYTRWLQFAVFSPILRPHGSGIPSEPVFWSEKTQDIVRKYMELRYKLLPYNYTMAWQNATKGIPLMRPLFYSFPNDTTVLNISDEYMWGDHLLVGAVTVKGQTSKRIYLPEGTWYDFHTGKKYNGKQWIEYPLSINDLPLLAKAGSLIPMTKPVSSTEYYKSDEFTIRYYPQGISIYTQYEDDGLDNHALRDRQFEKISYQGINGEKEISIRISKIGSWKGMPLSRKIVFEILRKAAPASVTINGEPVPLMKEKAMDNPGYEYREGWIHVNFEWKGEPVKIEIKDH